MLMRLKLILWAGDLNSLRSPGNEKNFLGFGAPGVKPFVTASYRARVSPHANVGYEFNGTSILGGATVGTKGRLPDELFYSGGADVGCFRRVGSVKGLQADES